MMKFRKISFQNYRCFMNGSLEFNEDNNKNINLIIAPNGGGKTELLFSFRWALYNIDFKNLEGKSDTPYSLNSDLYKKLELAEGNTNYEVKVTIELENDNKTYIIEKSECFVKNENGKITSEVKQIIRYFNEKYELSLPISDKNKINNILNKIIPFNIIKGIVFDGERMQKLSSPESGEAIQGVINDITSVELIEKCKENYKDVKKKISNLQKKIATSKNMTTLEETIKQIDSVEKDITSNKKTLEEDKKTLEICKKRILAISSDLQKVIEIKSFAQQRDNLKKEQDKLLKNYEAAFKEFGGVLNKGYLLVCDDLYNQISELIKKYDVPTGLTVQAVKSIIEDSSHKCICGKLLDEDAVNSLERLLLLLPPDNLNSTLYEVILSMKSTSANIKEELKKSHDLINKCEDSIKENKNEIARLTSQITSYNLPEAAALEAENNQLNQRIGALNKDIAILNDGIPEFEKHLAELKSIRGTVSKNNESAKKYQTMIDFADKSIVALDNIAEINKKEALKFINAKIAYAYKKLSEDDTYGKKIYIIQYDLNRKYQIVVYFERKLQETLDVWTHNGYLSILEQKGLGVDEIKELAIIHCSDSNSIGQAKMNALAFAKAILDYSNEKKNNEMLQNQKQYPLLIDAPFSDIAGENLTRSSMELHNFTHQIILMLDGDKYKIVENNISPYVSKCYCFEKTNDGNSSVFKEIQL